MHANNSLVAKLFVLSLPSRNNTNRRISLSSLLIELVTASLMLMNTLFTEARSD